MLGAFFIGLGAAVSNATSNILQRGAHIDTLAETNDEGFSLKFLLNVMRRPRWLAGIITTIISFILQTVGLAMSSLSVIQPVLVLDLPITLIVAAFFLKEKLTDYEWLGVVLMFTGVIIFVVMLKPMPGTVFNSISKMSGASAMTVTILTIAAFYILSQKVGPRAKTAILGLDAGITFGLTAIVIKDLTAHVERFGLFSIFSGWQVYTMIVFGLSAEFLFQKALASGKLMHTQPGVTLADPFVSIIWGIAVFHEDVRSGFYMLIAMIGVALTITGVYLLVRSPVSKSD